MSAFDKVIGCEAIKSELIRYCDVLKNAKRYKALGVDTPKGALLYGKPGVGKTLMTKCFIEESGLKSYAIRKEKPNGAFVDHIREVFEKAKVDEPSIVLLDDMDKFANDDFRHPNSEEYITVQSCIDELEGHSVFVIATANDIENLPDSLLRTGRFDKVINMTISENDIEAVFNHYLSGMKMAGNIDVKQISQIMHGRSCADLKAVVNEAGMYAGYMEKDSIDQEDMVRACLRIFYNAPEDIYKMSGNLLEAKAVHEAGHAVVSEMIYPGSVSMVSICTNTDETGGICITKETPEEKYDKVAVENSIIVALAGKAATEIVSGKADMCAAGDIAKAYEQISMLIDDLCVYGFDTYESDCAEYSDVLLSKKEIRVANEMEKHYQVSKKILLEYREFLDKVICELMIKGTLLRADIAKIKDEVGLVERFNQCRNEKWMV